MSQLKEFLSQYYGPGAAPDNGQLEKQAQMQLFCKLAADHNVDLTKLSEAEIQTLWTETFKVAEEDKEPEHKEKEEKAWHLEEKAKEEHDHKKEAAAKLAEAEYLGRFMAHSMVDEMKKIAAEGGLPGLTAPAEVERTKEGASPLHHAREAFRAHGVAKRLGKTLEIAKDTASGKDVTRLEKGIDTAKHMRNSHGKELGKQVGVGAAAAAGATGLAMGAKKLHDRNKEASVLDFLAGDLAIVKAAEAGFDPQEAADLVSAVLTLGAPESEKIASVQDVDQAKEVRALELLELAGYPVTWAS